MTKMIEVVYEDNGLKPLVPIDWLEKHNRIWVIVCQPQKKILHELIGTLTHEESVQMQNLINEEFNERNRSAQSRDREGAVPSVLVTN